MRLIAKILQCFFVATFASFFLAISFPSPAGCLASHWSMRGSCFHSDSDFKCTQPTGWRHKLGCIRSGRSCANIWNSIELPSSQSTSDTNSPKRSTHTNKEIKGLVLRGRVIDNASQPLSNMSVHAGFELTQRSSATSTSGYGVDQQTVFTDADGRFEVSVQPPQCSVKILISDATGARICSAYVPGDPTAFDPRLLELKPLIPVATANVKGMVSVDGKPLAGAQVYINSVTGGLWDRTDGFSKTDEKGRYEIRNIEAGKRLSVAYQSENPRYSIMGGRNCRTIGSLSPGQTLELNPFEFATRTRVVSGVVVDPAGRPLSDVAVETMTPNIGDVPAENQHRAITDMNYPAVRTGPDGRFNFEHLFDRPVRLCAIIKAPSADQNEHRFIRTFMTIDAGETNAKIVLDPNNNSPDGIQLQPGTENPSQQSSRLASSDVSSTELDQPANSVTKDTNKSQWLSNPDRQIAGQVLFGDTGEAVVNAQVDMPLDPFDQFVESTLTDAEGRFQVRVPPNYLLGSDSFDLSVKYADAPGYLTTRTTVTFLQDQSRQDVTVRLSNGEPVRGTVVDDATGARVPGVGVTYVLERESEPMSVYWAKGRQALTDEKGHFEILAPPNQVTLRVYQPPPGHHASHDVPNDFRWENNQSIGDGHSAQVTFEAGAAPSDVRLAVSRGLILRGRAIDLTGKPIPRAVVEAKYAILSEDDPMIRFDTQSEPYKAFTGEDGGFELSGLPPNCEALIRIHDSANNRKFATVVDADHGATGQREVQLKTVIIRPTASLEGQLLCEDKPIANVGILARMRLSGKAFHGCDESYTTTDNNGHFSFDRLDSNVLLQLSYWTRKYSRISERGIEPTGMEVEPLQPGEHRKLPVDSLTLKKSFVEGIIVDTEGHPLADVEIQTGSSNEGVPALDYREPVNDFFSGRRRELNEQDIRPMIRTGSDGKFRFEQLSDAPVTLFAQVLPSAGRPVDYSGTAYVKANANDANIRLEIYIGPPKRSR